MPAAGYLSQQKTSNSVHPPPLPVQKPSFQRMWQWKLTSAKVLIFPLYLMRHVRDGGPNCKTPADAWVIHNQITFDQIWAYRSIVFLSNFVAMCILCDPLRQVWAFTQCFWALTLPLEFLWAYHQPLKLVHYGRLLQESFLLYYGPNHPPTLLSPPPLLYPTLTPIQSHSHILCTFQIPKGVSPILFLVLFSLAYFSTSMSPSPPELFLFNTFHLVSSSIRTIFVSFMLGTIYLWMMTGVLPIPLLFYSSSKLSQITVI